MNSKLKKHETIGCCGIDCGLCPRFYTKGGSACPGCGGLNFREKHPSCGFLTCCAINKGLEVCSLCNEFPCNRFDAEKNGYDSFVTHRMVFANLDYIKNNGIGQFIKNQKVRINILNILLTSCDEGRSKSFYCIGCALLPLDRLQEIHSFILGMNSDIDIKEKSKLIKNLFMKLADSMNIELKLMVKKQ